MKKLYSLALLLMMIVCTSLSASAYQFTYEWDIPGSVEIRLGGMSKPAIELAADQTSYTFETTSSFGDIYIYATSGYYLVSQTLPDGTVKPAQTDWYDNRYFGGRLNSTTMGEYDGKVIHLNVIKIERTSEFTFNVENGVDCFTATFQSSGYELSLSNGINTVMFNPTIDTDLLINYKAGSIANVPSPALYSVTYDGTAVEKDKYKEQWAIPTVEPGKEVTVRVFENQEVTVPDCDLTLDIPENMMGCISNIRDWTKGVFLKNASGDYLTSGSFTVKEGTDLALNFNTDDFDVTDVLYNGTSLADKFQNGNPCRFIVNESGTLTIVGTPKVIPTYSFNAYIMNPEGVNIENGNSTNDFIALTDGADVTSDVKLDGYTLVAADSKEFSFDVTSKNPLLFVSPKEGWYITTVQYPEAGSYQIQTSAINKENTTFYVIATKFGETYTATVNKVGNGATIMLGSGTFANNWENPKHEYSLTEGTQDITFYPVYDVPMTIRPSIGINNFAAYVDGKRASTDSNSETTFILDPYYPATADDAQVHSTITVMADGTTAKTGTVTLTYTNTTAQMLYSVVRRDGGKNVALLYGTPVYIKPATTECNITVNGTLVHGEQADGTKINGLDANGEYTFEVNASLTKIEVVYDTSFAVTNTIPADGATVNKIGTVEVYLPGTVGSNENMPYTSVENVMKVSLKAEDGTTYYANSIGEPNQDWMTGSFIIPLTFEPITAAGTYTLTIPAGTFFESEYDEDLGEFVEASNAALSKAYTATITIDPTAISPIDNYTLTPESDSELHSLKIVYMTFPEYTAADIITVPDDLIDGAFSNGKVSYKAAIGLDYDYADARRIMIVPYNDDYEQVTITEDGTWELYLPAGTLKYKGEESSAVEANYFISASYPAYPITPTPGSTTGNLGKFTIEFPEASEVVYTDAAITLNGAGDFSASTMYVSGLNPFTIQFTKLPTEPGEYTLVIPAGAFTVDGEPSEAVEAKYTFKPVYELTPANGSMLESLDKITITFPEATSVEYVGNMYNFVLQGGGNAALPGLNCTKVDAKTFDLTLPEEAQKLPNGKINLRIEEGTFSIDGEASPEIQATYTLEGEVSTEWTASPDGTIIYGEYGFDWTFAFDDTTKVSAPDTDKIHVNYGGEELTYGQFEVMTENNFLMMGIFDTSLLKDGKLTVSIEAGAFTISGTPNPAMTYTWNVVAAKDYSSTVVPSTENKVGDLSTITIAFPEATTAEIFNPSFAYMRNDGYTYSETPTITEVADSEYPTFKFTFDPAPTVTGKYYFSCYRGAFTLDGTFESPLVELTYDFDVAAGVWNIGIDSNDTVTIVTIDGRVVAADVPAAEINSLEKGKIYIINGVKVFIK